MILLIASSLLARETLEQSPVEAAKLIAAKAAKEYGANDFAAAEKDYEKAHALAPDQITTLNYFAATELHLSQMK